MTYELIRADIINGKRRQYTESKGTKFASTEEMEQFRTKLKAEHPGCEVYLIYKFKEQ